MEVLVQTFFAAVIFRILYSLLYHIWISLDGLKGPLALPIIGTMWSFFLDGVQQIHAIPVHRNYLKKYGRVWRYLLENVFTITFIKKLAL
jgi:hypothetical protein